MKQVRVLKIVVASPGDVQAERDMIPAIVDELNKGIAEERAEEVRTLPPAKPRESTPTSYVILLIELKNL